MIAIGGFYVIKNTLQLENGKFRIMHINALVRMGALDDIIRSFQDTPSPQIYDVDEIGLDLTKNIGQKC
eukprot:10371209-Ditylum_brightwellii.AAC.1